MATVYLANDLKHGRRVARKVLLQPLPASRHISAQKRWKACRTN